MIFWSTNGWHLDGDHPEGAVEVTAELYGSLIGKPTEAGPDGQPRLTLEHRRAAVWEAIKAERDRRKSAGAKAGDYWFHSDADSRIQQLGLYTKATNGSGVPSTQWKTMSGAFRPMTNQLAIDIFNAVEALDLALFTRAEVLRAQVNASADPESIDILAGWPQSYEESL